MNSSKENWESFRRSLNIWEYEQFKFRGLLMLSLIFLGITYFTNREPNLNEFKTVNLLYKTHRKKITKSWVTWYFRFDNAGDEYALGGYNEVYFDKSLFNIIQPGDTLKMRVFKDNIFTIEHCGKTYTDINRASKAYKINTSSLRLSTLLAAFIFSIPLFLKTQPVFRFRSKEYSLKCNLYSVFVVYFLVMIVGVLNIHFFPIMWL